MNGVETGPRLYEAECHDKVPWDQLQVQERAELKQLPDWLRRALGLPERFRRGHEARVAAEVEFCLNEILERMVAGCSRDFQSSCTIKTPVLVSTANKVLDKWHEMYEKVCKDEAIVPELSRAKRLDNKWIYKFLQRWQWSHQNSNTKGAYLPDTSAEMADMRKAHRAQREINGVSWPLVLNFDQMWKSAYEPPSKVLHKTQHRNKDKEICRPSDGERLKVISQIVTGDLAARIGHGSGRPSKVRKGCARTGVPIQAVQVTLFKTFFACSSQLVLQIISLLFF